jgi:uncharacterized protein YydD (DUF2326 family)
VNSKYREDNMQPFQQRVVDEKKELDEKIDALESFLQSINFDAVPTAEQMRLKMQHGIMTDYSMILGERIAAFV